MFRKFLAPDPKQIFTTRFREGPPENVKKELAISYGKYWSSNPELTEHRARLLNVSLILLLVAAGWIIVISSILSFLRVGVG